MNNDFKHLTDNISFPLVIWKNKSLNPTEKMILVDIIGLVKTGSCFKGNEAFAELVGLSKSRVSAIISGLDKRGYIKVTTQKQSNNSTRRDIFLTEDFRKSLIGNLFFKEYKISSISSDRGFREQNEVLLKSSRGIPIDERGSNCQQLGGITASSEYKKSIKKSIEDNLNLITEPSSVAEIQVDLFGNNEPEITSKKTTKQKAVKKEAHKSHNPIKKFWFEEFNKGARFQIGDGVHINRIIQNIEELFVSRNALLDPEAIVNFFKTLCYEKKKVNSNFISNSGLSVMGGADNFKSIVDSIEKNNNGKPNNNNGGQRSGVTNFRFNVPDPRRGS